MLNMAAKQALASDTTSQEIKISLLTIGPGSQEVYTIFGHSAIRVVDPANLTDLSYNYGTFDFRTPNFYPKFLRGKLPYILSVAPTSAFLQEYLFEKRGVTEQVINMSDSSKQKLIAALTENAKPENREYMYDFFLDNCATRIRDMFLDHADSKVVFSEDNATTRRIMIHEYLVGFAWTTFGIDLIIGSTADVQIGAMDQMFLPDYMQRFLGEAVQDSSFLFEPSTELLFFEEDKEALSTSIGGPFLVFSIIGFLILLVGFVIKKPFGFIGANAIFALLGLASIIILFMWFGTDHKATKLNYNVLWLNPLYLLVPFVGFKLGRILLILLIAVALVCLFGLVPQDMPVMTLLPMLVFCAVAYIIGYPQDEHE